MLARISVAAIALALATMVAAAPATLDARTDTCNSGSIQCCDSVVAHDSPAAASAIGGLLSITALLDGPIGLNCSPIQVIAVGGNHCTQQTACCTGNTFNGLVTLGCSPINIGF